MDSTSFRFRVSNGWAYIPEKNNVIIINANDPSAMTSVTLDASTNVSDLNLMAIGYGSPICAPIRGAMC